MTLSETLTRMIGGQRRQVTINGHRVRLVCTMVGERHAWVAGVRVDLAPGFDERIGRLTACEDWNPEGTARLDATLARLLAKPPG